MTQIKFSIRSLLKTGLFCLLAYSTAPAEEPPITSSSPSSSIPSSSLSRRESRQIFNASIGPALFTNLAAGGVGFLLGGAYGWDLGEAILKLNIEAAISGGTFWTGVGPGVQGFFLVQGDVAPYAAANFGVTYCHADNNSHPPRSVTGFSAGAALGVVLFRNANVSFDAGLHYTVLLKENGFGLPQMATLKVGMWF